MRELPLYLIAILFSFLAIFLFINIGHIKILLLLSVLLVMLITFQSSAAAIYFLVISMLLSPEIKVANVPGRSVDIRFDDFMLIVIFFTYLFKLALNKELGLLKASPLNINLLLLILIMIVSTLLGVMTWNVKFVKASFYLLKMVEYYFLFFLVLNNLQDEAHIEKLINLLFFVCFIVCIYAYSQIFQGLVSTAPFEGGPGEAEPASFGGYLLVIYGQLLGWALYSKSKTRRIILLLLFVFSFVPFLYSQSRASYIGFVVFILSVVFFFKKARLPVFISTILLLIGFIAKPPEIVLNRVMSTFMKQNIPKEYKGQYQDKIKSDEIQLDESSMERIRSWQMVVLKNMPNRPFFGYGITGMGFIDSQYFLYLVEIGILGLLAFVILIVRIFVFTFRVFDNAASDTARAVSFGLITSLSGLLVHALTSNTFIIIRIMEPFWLIVACTMFLYMNMKQTVIPEQQYRESMMKSDTAVSFPNSSIGNL